MARLFTSQVPGLPDVNEGINVTVGISVVFDTAGTVTGGWFYAPATLGAGTFEAAFWVMTHADGTTDAGTGTLLANALFSSITPGAWNNVTFSSGVAVDSSHVYVISLRTSEGRYAATSAFFVSALVNGHITGIQGDTDPVGLGAIYNGRFIDSSITLFPKLTFNHNCYFVDVDFTPSGAAAGFPFNGQPRRRLQPPPRRARASTPVRAQQNPPYPFVQAKRPRRIRAMLSRRGRSSTPVPAQIVVVAPGYPYSGLRARIRGILPRRAKTVTPVPAQVTVPLVYPPQPVRIRIRGILLRKQRISSPPLDQSAPPVIPRVRIKLPRLFRPRSSTPVPAQAVVLAPAYPLQSVRSKLRGILLRRAKVSAPPMPQAPAPPGPRIRRPNVPARRGHSFSPVPPQVAPTPPPPYPLQSVRKRLNGILLRRPRISAPAPLPTVAPTPPTPPTPPAPAAAPNGWFGLMGIMRGIRIIRQDSVQRELHPIACPNDGEPLSRNRDGIIFCKYDGWMPPGQGPIVATAAQADWGGMGAVVEQARADESSDEVRLTLACPNDGEPLRRSLTGELYCPFDNFRPPRQ